MAVAHLSPLRHALEDRILRAEGFRALPVLLGLRLLLLGPARARDVKMDIMRNPTGQRTATNVELAFPALLTALLVMSALALSKAEITRYTFFSLFFFFPFSSSNSSFLCYVVGSHQTWHNICSFW